VQRLVSFSKGDSIFARIDAVISHAKTETFWNAAKTVTAWLAWEAGILWSPDRGRVGWTWHVQEPNEANDARSRTEIIRKVHEFERNNAIVNRLLDVFEIFTVGAGGMPIIPASSDPKWNEKRKVLWDRWCRNPDLTSLQTFGTLQGLCARRWPADGNVYVYLTRSDQKPYRPRIQLLEASHLETPLEENNPNIIDGHEVDSRGRTIAYWFRFKEGNKTSHRRIDAKFIVPIGKPMRPGELRQMSFFAPVLNDVQDLEELSTFAMRKAKESARLMNVFKTQTGEMPTSEDIRRAKLNIQTKTAEGINTTKDKLREIETVTGSKSIAIKTDEELSQVGAETPNEIEQAHWDIVVNRICAGFGVTKLLVFPNSMQGTVVRADLDIATTWFRAHSAILIEAFLAIYRYVTDEECKIEISIADRPIDWDKAVVRPPRAPNVDVGRNSAAMIAELAAGATNFRNIYGPLGMDAREELTSLADDLAFIKQLAEARGIPVEWMRTEIANATIQKLQEENQKQQDSEDAQLKQAA
jgi:hypothetical protein